MTLSAVEALRALPEPQYRCSSCGTCWTQERPSITVCVSCRSERVTWENYDEWKAEAGLYPYTGTVASILRPL